MTRSARLLIQTELANCLLWMALGFLAVGCVWIIVVHLRELRTP